VCGGNTTVASYLEGGNQNGATTNTFIAGESNNSFNDKLLPVTRDALFPVVEARVVRELRSSLVNYYAANRFYPYSAPFPNNVSTAATYRGYVPTTTSSCLPGSPDLLSYLPGYSASPPGWFVSNEWHKVIVYAVAPRCTPRMTTNLLWLGTASACAVGGCLGPIFGLYACLVPVALDPSANNCNNSGSYLTVSGATNVQSIVFAASYGFGGQSRPCNSITDCLETVGGNNENIDTDNYIYVKPLRSTANNDTLLTVAP
jgi:hypothetical protein